MRAPRQADRALSPSATEPVPVSSPDGVTIAGAWPCWEVGVYGFGDVYVIAPSNASARWWVVSQMHEAGYGDSPIELIQRGITVREVSETFAGVMGDIHRVVRRVRR